MFVQCVEYFYDCGCDGGVDRMDGIMFVGKGCVAEVFCGASMWLIYCESVSGEVRMCGVMLVEKRCVEEVCLHCSLVIDLHRERELFELRWTVCL